MIPKECKRLIDLPAEALAKAGVELKRNGASS
jgi:hypothetical protein